MTRALARVRGPAGRFRIERRSQAARDATVCRAAAEVPPIAACGTITAETFFNAEYFHAMRDEILRAKRILRDHTAGGPSTAARTRHKRWLRAAAAGELGGTL